MSEKQIEIPRQAAEIARHATSYLREPYATANRNGIGVSKMGSRIATHASPIATDASADGSSPARGAQSAVGGDTDQERGRFHGESNPCA
jgi:hypothetical protein